MTAVVLALAGAVAYGISDFIGGLTSRRGTVWPVAALTCVGALLGTVVLGIAVPGHPHAGDVGWGLLAGVGTGAGTGFLYQGLAQGRMGVVAPVSAVGAAIIPVLVGVLTGERPGVVVWIGMVAALPGIWLVAQEERGEPADEARPPSGLVWGLLAGIGFGALFAALGQVGSDAGYWPVAAAQLASVPVVVAIALLLGGDPRPSSRHELWGLVSGLLATAAVVGFLLARQHGLLSVSAVLTSLYPALTVLLAALVLHERVHRVQGIGLLCCGAAVVCVALG